MKPATGFLAILLDPLGRFFLGAAADFANHDDAVRVRVVVEQFDDVQMRHAGDRIAADADAGALARAAAGQLPDRLVSERAAARDHADVAFFVNVTGRNADAAAAVRILAFAGRDDAGTIRPDEPRRGVALHRAFHANHVARRNAFGDADDQFQVRRPRLPGWRRRQTPPEQKWRRPSRRFVSPRRPRCRKSEPFCRHARRIARPCRA